MDAANTLNALAERIGPGPADGSVPAAVRRQKWSALNVPLMWAAAGTDADCAVLKYLQTVARLMTTSVRLAGVEMPASDSLHTAWLALGRPLR